MGLYASIRILMDFCGSLSVVIRPYGLQWVLMGPYTSLCVIMDCNGSYVSLCVFMNPYVS